MVLFEAPEETTSYKSWRDVTGCCCVLVQCRTGDGLKKNNTVFHKFAYNNSDLEPYRIIVCDPPDTRINFTETGPGTTDHENDEPLRAAKKWVLATAATEQEILFWWDLMRRQFRLPYCGSVAAAAREDADIPKRDAVRERRLAAAILPSWPTFYKATASAQAARKRNGSNGDGGEEQQQQRPTSSLPPSSPKPTTVATSPASPAQMSTPAKQQQQQGASPSSPAAQQQHQQQQKFAPVPAAPLKQQQQDQETKRAPSPDPVGSPTTQRARAFANSYGIEEKVRREDIVVKELPGIERSVAAACLKLQPTSLSGLVYLAVLTGYYLYARTAAVSPLLDIAIVALFLWHCKVPFGSDEYGNYSASSPNSNNNNSNNASAPSVQEALRREKEIDALGGLGRLLGVFSLQYPPAAVSMWIVVHFLSSMWWPETFPDGIWPFVGSLMLPCTIGSLILAPHIGPVLRPAPKEAFEKDPFDQNSGGAGEGADDNYNDGFSGFSAVSSDFSAGAPPGAMSLGGVNSNNNNNNSSSSAMLPGWRSPSSHHPKSFHVSSPTNGSMSGSVSPTSGVVNNSSLTGGGAMPAMVKKCLQLWKQGGSWKLTKENNGVIYKTKPVPWCKPLAIWVTTTIPQCRATDVEAVLCDDADGSNKNSFAYKFDKMLDRRYKVSELQQEPWFEHVWCTKFKTPVFTVKARELVTRVSPIYYLSLEQQARWDIKSDTGVVYTFCGTSDDAAVQPPDTNYERGTMYAYGMFAVESGGGVILHQILSMELGGYIPGWIVNMTNEDNIERVAVIRDLAYKHRGTLPLQGGPYRPEAAISDKTRSLIQPDPDAETRAKKRADAAAAANSKGTKSSAASNNSQQQQQQQEQEQEAVEQQPQRHPAYSGTVPSAVTKGVRLILDNQFTLVKTDAGIEYSTGPSPYCGKVAVKLHTVLPAHIRAADVRAVFDDDPKGRNGKNSSAFKFDRLLDARILLRQVSEHEAHWRTCYKSPVWGVGARDMCTIYNSFFVDAPTAAEQWKMPQAKLLGTSAPCPVPEMYVVAAEDNGKNVPTDSNFVRGAVHAYMIIAVDTPRGVDLTTVLSVDPQGSIPASLVDATNLEQLEKMKIQRDLFLAEAAARKAREEAVAAAAAARKRQQLEQQAVGAAAAASSSSSSSSKKDGATLSRRHGVWPTDSLPTTLARCMKMYREADWKEVKSQDGVVFHDAVSPFCSKRACVFEMMIPMAGMLAEDVDSVVNDDKTGGNPNANAYTYDRLLTKRILIKKSADESQWTWRTCFKSPVWGVGARDFCFVCESGYLSPEHQKQIGFEATPFVEVGGADGKKSPGEVWFFSSEDRCNDCPVDPNYTRGNIHAFTILAVETGRGVRLVQIMSIDPCGYLPASVIDATNAEQIQKLIIMKRMMEQAAQKRTRKSLMMRQQQQQ